MQEKLASAREDIIELQMHDVRPGACADYADAHAKLVARVAANRDTFRCEALGSFRVVVGDQDQQVKFGVINFGRASALLILCMYYCMFKIPYLATGAPLAIR